MNVTNQNLEKMEDSLKVTENEDGTFELSWDEKDPKWAWMNNLPNEQIQIIVQQAIQDYLDDLRSPEF